MRSKGERDICMISAVNKTKTDTRAGHIIIIDRQQMSESGAL